MQAVYFPSAIFPIETLQRFDSWNVYVTVIMIHQNTMGVSHNHDMFAVLPSVLCNPGSSLI